jgi:exonuclease III
VDKDDQIIHDEQVNGDQEQKKDKLPSKRVRRLPTTRHDDFFMVGHQRESINVQDIETSFTVFHQNIRGLFNKSEELISFLSLDFPQVLCLTEHHLKHFEIDYIYIYIYIYIYMEQYKLGTKFCKESYKSDGVSIFVRDTLQCTNINLDEFCKEQNIKTCAVKINLLSLTICNISIYRSQMGFFLHILDSILNFLQNNTIEIITCGDFNINYLNENDKESKLCKLLFSYNLYSTEKFPTRIYDNTITAIIIYLLTK